MNRIRPTKFSQIMDRLASENKSRLLNEPNELAAFQRVDSAMETVRQEYRTKERLSRLSAARTLLNS